MDAQGSTYPKRQAAEGALLNKDESHPAQDTGGYTDQYNQPWVCAEFKTATRGSCGARAEFKTATRGSCGARAARNDLGRIAEKSRGNLQSAFPSFDMLTTTSLSAIASMLLTCRFVGLGFRLLVAAVGDEFAAKLEYTLPRSVP